MTAFAWAVEKVSRDGCVRWRSVRQRRRGPSGCRELGAGRSVTGLPAPTAPLQQWQWLTPSAWSAGHGLEVAGGIEAVHPDRLDFCVIEAIGLLDRPGKAPGGRLVAHVGVRHSDRTGSVT